MYIIYIVKLKELLPFVYYNWPGELLFKMCDPSMVLCSFFSCCFDWHIHVVFLLTHHWFPLIIHAIVPVVDQIVHTFCVSTDLWNQRRCHHLILIITLWSFNENHCWMIGIHQGRIITFRDPRLMKLWSPRQTETPSNSPAPVLDNFHSWSI